ncbi:MAG: hypothetical protein FWD57_12155, partial [Polyangiaceae bacterium]|nr:hypothetical protein [Polyangiaceae bacterium]
MKIDHVPYGHIETVRLRWISDNQELARGLKPGAEALLQYSERHAQAILRVGSDVMGVEGFGRKHEAALVGLCTRHLPRIAWVLDVGRNHISIQVHTFMRSISVPALEIGVDHKVLRALDKVDPSLGSANRALHWLSEQFLLPTNGGARAFVSIDSDDRAISICGRTARAYAGTAKPLDSASAFVIDRIVRGNAQQDVQVALVTGDLRFVDGVQTAAIGADAYAQLSSIESSGSSFTELWSKYGTMEEAAVLRRAREAGGVPYECVDSMPDGRFR